MLIRMMVIAALQDKRVRAAGMVIGLIFFVWLIGPVFRRLDSLLHSLFYALSGPFGMLVTAALTISSFYLAGLGIYYRVIRKSADAETGTPGPIGILFYAGFGCFTGWTLLRSFF